MVGLPGLDGLPVTGSAIAHVRRFCINSGNQQACCGNVNVYGVEKQRVKCSSSICPGK